MQPTISKLIKLGPKCHNRLLINLEFVEDQEQGGEGIGDRVRVTVGIQHSKHIKTVAIVNVPLDLKEESKGPNLYSKMELAFPDMASLEVGHGHYQLAIRMASGKLWLLKVELDDAQCVKVGLCFLDGVELKFVVEDDGKARPDGENGVVGGGGDPHPGLENDMVASDLEEEWCSLCAKEECSNEPIKTRLGATKAGAQGYSPGQTGKGPPP